jgi:DNA-binding NtrC family response regulator
MTSPRVLIIDDEIKILTSLKMALSVEEIHADVAGDLEAGRRRFEKESYDAVLLDVSLPDGNGVDFLGELKKSDSSLVVIMMSGQATVELAVEATRRGAADFLEKPISTERMLLALRNALKLQEVEREAGALLEESGQLRELRGESPKMQELRSLVTRAARSNAHVLLHGERGTGKELVARAIHEASPRSQKKLEKINCAAVPENLIESELFGHEPGAFTGATKRRIGRFERADGGTLFLDEVGDMPAAMQVKLLRVLQEQELERVGSTETIRIDVRVVAASNKDLQNECAEGRFRADLYDRLNVVPLFLPPLRERTGDIETLAAHFFDWAKKRNDRPGIELSDEALQRIIVHNFPGNVRELRNLMERIVILCPSERVEKLFVESCGISGTDDLKGGELYREGHSFKELSDEAERMILEQALRAHDGQMAKTARALGLERSHLYKKAKSLGLRDT